MDAEQERRFAAFVSSYRDRAVGLAWRLAGGDRAAAEDIAQEAFVRAYRSLHRFREESSLATWFYRILLNEAHRHRTRWWHRRQAAEPVSEETPDPRPGSPGDPALRGRRIGAAIERLPRGQREAFVMVHLDGFSVREVADITGRASGTIKSHLHRARKALQNDLADLGGRP